MKQEVTLRFTFSTSHDPKYWKEVLKTRGNGRPRDTILGLFPERTEIIEVKLCEEKKKEQ